MNLDNNYQSYFNYIKNIVNTADPAGLIAGGAPDDEYEDEIAKIMPFIRGNKNPDQIADLIYGIFKDSLGDNVGTKESYIKIAQQLLAYTIQ